MLARYHSVGAIQKINTKNYNAMRNMIFQEIPLIPFPPYTRDRESLHITRLALAKTV